MYIAINKFTVVSGREQEFEEIWRNRESYLDAVPEFMEFNLLRSEPGAETTIFLSHSQWQSEQAFTHRTHSEVFRLPHKRAKSPAGVVLGPPEFSGYNTVDLL